VDRIKNLVVCLDHDDTIISGPWDDVTVNLIAELPKVLSPVKVQHIEKNDREKLPEFYKKSNEDSDFFDSDNEVDGDDDLFVDHVDVMDEGIFRSKNTTRAKKAKGSRMKGEEHSLTAELSSNDYYEELLLPSDDIDAQVNIKSSTFRPKDLSSPVFKVGMVFESLVKLRTAITEYSLKKRVEIKLPRNENKRIRAHCAEGCPWNLYTSYDSRMKAITVKTYAGRHNADKYLESFRANYNMSISNFAKTVQKDWNLTPSKTKLAKVRRLAMRKIYGDEKDFCSGYRPLICLDGCHIKTKFGGQILTIVCIDPNDCIYPIALAVDAGFKGEILKNQLWTCARASTVSKFEHHMGKMKELNEDAYNWLQRMPTNTWVRAYFAEFPKSDILLNNNCEVFNKYILEAREMSILSIWKRGVWFQVLDRDFQYIVNIINKECECRKCNLTGIPCQHAISCLRYERIPPESMLHDCYTLKAINKTYETNIMPCRDKSTCDHVDGPEVRAPIYEKKVGRPRRCRRKEPSKI
uniref:SWIM-type domain-containing protein n=1 Tax=Setaria italica TaxID=4555 RepID=K3YET2_SETIT